MDQTDSSSIIRRSPRRRSLDDILARMEARERLPRMLPPDFVHGEFELGESYDHIERLEQTAFVVVGEQRCGVAKYRGHFLTLFAHQGQTPSRDWLAHHLEGIERVVFWVEPGQGDVLEGQSLEQIHVELARERMIELEQAHLSLVREQAAMQGSLLVHNDLLSLIGLYVHARLERFVRPCSKDRAA